MKITIDGQAYTPSLPIGVTYTNEGGLDQACIKLRHIKRMDAFLPFTRVEMLDRWWVIARDDVVREIYINRATHTIMLVEITKELERVICGAKTFTRPLKTTYVPIGVEPAYYKYGKEIAASEIGDDFIRPIIPDWLPFKSPITTDTITVLGTGEELEWVGRNAYDEQTVKTASFRFDEEEYISIPDGMGANITIGDAERIQVKYTAIHTMTVLGSPITRTCETVYTLYATNTSYEKHPLTVYEVVNRLLATAETTNTEEHRKWHHFVITNDKRNGIDTRNIEAPEFSFANGATLKENLDQIAKFLHAKVKAYVGGWHNPYLCIYFVPLTSEKRAVIKGTLIGDQTAFDSGKYAGRIFTNAANLVINNTAEASVAEPSGLPSNDWNMSNSPMKTLRCADNAARINEETGEIETVLPIRKITKVLMKQPNKEATVDITPYVNEEARYLGLSSYTGEQSKAYALYYTQGAKNIKGVFFKDEGAKPDALKRYAIVNIYNEITGESDDSFANYKDLLFYVEYEPYLDVCLVQSRVDGKGGNITYIANQAANEMDKDALANFLRGTVEQMASDAPKRTYLMKTLAQVPNVGEMYDEHNYISEVSFEIYPYFVKCMISISEHYNRLGEHVEVPNAVRQYEIDVKNVHNRNVLYTDVCRISFDQYYYNATDSLLSDYGKDKIMRWLEGGYVPSLTDGRLTVAEVRTYRAQHEKNVLPIKNNKKLIEKVMLPVASFGFGNSLAFIIPFKDNFSAGTAAKIENERTNSENELVKYNAPDYVRYGDNYGDAEFAQIDLYNGMSVSPEKQATVGRSFPLSVKGLEGVSMGERGVYTARSLQADRCINLYKDSRERITFIYQLLFQADNDIIIGSDLADLCPLVCDWSKFEGIFKNGARLHFYGDGTDGIAYLNPVTGTVATGDHFVGMLYDGECLELTNVPPAHSSWALIFEGHFLLGSNSPFPSGGKLHFYFCHEL